MRRALADVVGQLVEQPGGEQFGEAVGGRDAGLVDARLAVDAEADGHPALGNREQGLVGARERAAGERDAERAGAVVGACARRAVTSARS